MLLFPTVETSPSAVSLVCPADLIIHELASYARVDEGDNPTLRRFGDAGPGLSVSIRPGPDLPGPRFYRGRTFAAKIRRGLCLYCSGNPRQAFSPRSRKLRVNRIVIFVRAGGVLLLFLHYNPIAKNLVRGHRTDFSNSGVEECLIVPPRS